MTKSATFGVMHVGIAFGVSYSLTGSVAIAGAIIFVEPLVNTVAHYFFEKGLGLGAPDRPVDAEGNLDTRAGACRDGFATRA